MLDEHFECRLGVGMLDFADLEAVFRSFGALLIPNGHTTPPIMLYIAVHTAP